MVEEVCIMMMVDGGNLLTGQVDISHRVRTIHTFSGHNSIEGQTTLLVNETQLGSKGTN